MINNRYFKVYDIKAKMIALSYREQFVLIPLLHSLDECNEYIQNLQFS